jgi:hypothetical protein
MDPANIISDAIFYSVTGDDSTCNSLKINRLNGKCNSKSGFILSALQWSPCAIGKCLRIIKWGRSGNFVRSI